MAESFGLKIGLEGEKEFKASLAEINNSFKVLGSEMKLVDYDYFQYHYNSLKEAVEYGRNFKQRYTILIPA